MEKVVVAVVEEQENDWISQLWPAEAGEVSKDEKATGYRTSWTGNHGNRIGPPVFVFTWTAGSQQQQQEYTQNKKQTSQKWHLQQPRWVQSD